MSPFASLSLVAVLAVCAVASSSGQAPTAENRPRDLNTRHLFSPPATRAEWKSRSSLLRTRILHAAGLLPLPQRTPLNPVITGRVIGPDYIIENVAIETFPGFWLCGNVYAPRNKRGRLPAIVNPHGHWANGRLHMEEDVPKAPPPPAGPAPGRANLVAIGVNLARQGYICFAYDMAGYNDTNQVSHRFAGDLRSWSWGISLLGLQLWNSIRVVDYLLSRPDVDPRRIGATGASGGGTQTFLLCAVDDRVKVGVPVNMVSATMQGGCLCENGPGLRLDTDNAEIAALMAPRPLLLIACTGDWTAENPTAEWPAIKKVYDLHGAGDRTACVQFNYGHNYNVESREAMYAWFNRWLQSRSEPYQERPFEADIRAMRVWTAERKMPPNALDESGVWSALRVDAERALDRAWPSSTEGLQAFGNLYRPALRAALGMLSDSAPSRAPNRRGAVLIVTDSANRERAEKLRAEMSPAPTRLLVSDAPPMSAADLWKDFHSCYNLTPLAVQAQRIAAALAGLDGEAAPRAVVALGSAGPAALLVAAAVDYRGALAAHLDLPGDPDAAFAGVLYAPGIRRAGDLSSALLLRGRYRTLLLGQPTWLHMERLQETTRQLGGSLEAAEFSATPAAISGFLRK